MNPIKTTQRLRTALINYLSTTFNVNKDGNHALLSQIIRQEFEKPEALFAGPFLEMILPYKTGETLSQFCDEHILSTELMRLSSFNLPDPQPIPLNAPLYVHQCKAIKKLSSEHRSVIVSSGTGSGKTECFMIPIINDLLLDDTPGVRALLIYPMNALVNDQLKRLRVILKDSDITFGRYTSELKKTAERTPDILPNEIISRREIQEEGRVPQILITNYAMLEYLLLRPEDSILFDEGLWKYLVLDEAHTYSGAKGIEVAMLIRRLKLRLGKQIGDMLCIGTSATLGSDDAEKATKFGRDLFGEDFTLDDVIFGEENSEDFSLSNTPNEQGLAPEIYVHEEFAILLDEIRKPNPNVMNVALQMQSIGLIKDKELEKADSSQGKINQFLYEALLDNCEINQLQKEMLAERDPVDFSIAAKRIFPDLQPEQQLDALYHLVELGALARQSENHLPLIPAKYLLFARAPQGIWACLNPDCPGKENQDQSWSRIFSAPRKVCEFCGAKVFPIFLCRECGQVFISAQYAPDQSVYEPVFDDVLDDTEQRYLTWSKIEENYALKDEKDTIEEDEHDEEVDTDLPCVPISICLRCGHEKSQCVCEKDDKLLADLFVVNEKDKKIRKGREETQLQPIKFLNKCPRCGYKSKGTTEIATAVTITGVAPRVNLLYELYRGLPPSTDETICKLPGEGRKILTFYDNRQGAARFAAFFQDVAVNQNYKNIVPFAVDQLQSGDDWGRGTSPTIIPLSRKCAAIAWENQIIQSDVDFDYWQKYGATFSDEVRREASIFMAKHILAEFTTLRKSRQSLEQMGLVGIKYAFEDQPDEINKLARRIGLSLEKTTSLVAYLLDDLRTYKGIELPDSVYPDDPVFGVYKWQKRIVRQGEGDDNQKVAFIGKTARQRRRRYVELVLRVNGLNADEYSVKSVMTDIWDWMLDTGGILAGSPVDGYLISRDQVMYATDLHWFRCNRCQRLLYRGTELSCPYPNCGGEAYPVEIESIQFDNYFYNLFHEALIPVRIEEHTAQLDSTKAQEYQEAFNAGKINILSCSTTFELGIDLEDLQTVGMSNVPPTVANYRQRAGRAGRRVGGTGFILTWASDRPHDQAYFDTPIEIVAGKVAVPRIVLDNPFILQRHVNAILLSQFLRFRHNQGYEFSQLRYCDEFFDLESMEEPHLVGLDPWIHDHQSHLEKLLARYGQLLEFPEFLSVSQGLKAFRDGMHLLNDEHYQPVTNHYREKIKALSEKLADTALGINARNTLIEQIRFFQGLLERMRGGQTHGFLIDYLSSKGILPSYSFPLNTVELILPKEYKDSSHLRLERDIRQAIREYAPESEIVADKRIWRSKKPIFWKNIARVSEYRICANCHYLELSDEAGVELPDNGGSCPVCGSIYTKDSKIRNFVEPDGFLADPKSGKFAKQFVNVLPSQMRSALMPERDLEKSYQNRFYDLMYNRKGKLLYVNEGAHGKGFRFSLGSFGFFEDSKDKSLYSLGHIETTDTLHIAFTRNEILPIPPARDMSFWISLMFAILQGASISLQIERRDIDGVLSPVPNASSWEQTIVLFDNVPGGAGHVKNIHDNFDFVLQEANRILNCNDCSPETSCNHCLRDYSNQYYYPILRRDSALKFLDGYFSHKEPVDADIPGSFKVVAPNLLDWISSKVSLSKYSVSIYLTSLDEFTWRTDDDLWLDVINELILKDKTVNLFLQQLPNETPKGYSQAKYLQVLIEKGLNLAQINRVPDWRLFIDVDSPEPRAIATQAGRDAEQLKETLTTTNPKGVENALLGLSDISSKKVRLSELDPPPNITVRNLRTSMSQNITEEMLFADVFQKPCKQLLVHDPYLNDSERIINRLGAYIRLAQRTNALEDVLVISRKADRDNGQSSAEREVNNMFGGIVRFKHTASHDRFIEITRTSGEKARIIIGRGLEFINSDGTVKDTFIIIQDPLNE